MRTAGVRVVPLTAGLAIRGPVRVQLAQAGIEFTEVRSFWESVFQVQCNEVQEAALRRWVQGIAEGDR